MHNLWPTDRLLIDNACAAWQLLCMTLDEYLFKNKIRASAFAHEIGVSPSTITRAIKGERQLRLDIAVKIEDHTDRKVPVRSWLPGYESEVAS